MDLHSSSPSLPPPEQSGGGICDHDCKDFTVLTGDTGEFVCVKCGAVDEEDTASFYQEMAKKENAMLAAATDHNTGNGLYSSQTVQQGYISRRNPGVAFALNNPWGKDFSGKRIKAQLIDPYKTGLIADESRGFHTEQDPLTGKVDVVISKYDVPILQWVKTKAVEKCADLGLDTVQQTQIAQEIKRICSNLLMSHCTEYAVAAALYKYEHYLPASERERNQEDLVKSIERIRREVLSTVQGPQKKDRPKKATGKHKN